VKAVCNAFFAILKEWVRRYTPSMTYSNELSTSSGSILLVDKELLSA
jgi:phosphoglucomutase